MNYVVRNKIYVTLKIINLVTSPKTDINSSSNFLLKKLIVVELIKKFPASYELEC
jgi:hypothetical protein